MITVRYDKSKKLACINSIFVSFPYDEFIVNTLRSYPDRVYHNTTKEWELPQEALEYLKGKIKDKFKIIGKPQIEEEKEIKEYSLPKKLKTKLYKFQEEVYNAVMNHDKYLLLLFMGAGKSLISIAAACKRKELNQIDYCIIITCINGVKWGWKDEVLKHSNEHVKILGESNRSTISTQDKLGGLSNLDTFFTVTNIESLRQKEVLEKLKKLVKTNRVMVVVDEIHLSSNPSSQQGKGLLQLAKYTKYFYGLTGTLLKNTPLSAYLPLKCVGRETVNYSQFKNRYCVFGGWNFYSVVGYRNLEELQNKIKFVSSQLVKSDVLDLPPKVYINEYVEMGSKQQKIYNDVKRAVMKDIDNIILTLDPLAQMIRLRQATGYTGILSSTVHESAKLERLKDLVSTTDGKIIIFSNWTQITDVLMRELKEYSPVDYTGKTVDREKNKGLFLSDEKVKILVGTIGAAGTGLNLQVATTAIFFDEPWDSGVKLQAEDRIHRIGTTSSVNIITLITKNTIDEYINTVVNKKRVMSEVILEEKYDIRDKNVLEYLVTGDERLLNG